MADTPKQQQPGEKPGSEDMQKKIEDLQAELEATRLALQQSEQVQADILRQISSIPISQEVYVGKRKKIVQDKAGNDVEEEVDVYKLTINLPPSGGLFIKINDFPLYSGQTYNLEMDTIRTVKDMMYRAWLHENNVAGDEREVAYKPQGTGRVGPGGIVRAIQ